MDTRILIAGAGPVGMTMALLLARKGIPLRIVDKAPARTTLSKALVVWPRTLESFATQGLAQRLVDAGMRAHGVHLWDDDDELMSLDFGGAPTAYPYALMLPQRDTERILEDALADLGVTVERRVALVGFDAEEDGVQARLLHAAPDALDDDDGARIESCRAEWLIGCDGAHSTVRHALPGATFEGETLPTHWVLADVALHGALPHDALSLFLNRDGMLAAIPFGEGRFRVIADIGELRDGALRDASGLPAPTLDEVQTLLDARCRVPARAADPQWLSRIVINERKVRDYRYGRVFLAGDAAHVHSPAGGQGMNTGMQDAFNLAWKLALVCEGAATPALLDTYSVERSAIGDQVLGNAGNLTRMATVRNPLLQRLRALTLGALGHLDGVRRQLVEQFTELDLHYGDSPLTLHRARGVHAMKPGARMPDWPLAPGAGADGDADAHAGSLYGLLSEGRVVVLSVGCPAVTLAPPLDRIAMATSIRAADGVEPGHVLLVRPDGYLMGSERAGDAAGALAALRAWLPPATPAC